MIIACERCETRFHLDDSRIPDKGVRVRCSKCKHTFQARREGVTEDDALHAIAAEAAETGGQFAPDATEDLPIPAESAEPEPGEQDWQFNIDPEDEPGIDREAVEGPSAPSFLDDLGNPESWDLVGEAPDTATPLDAAPLAEDEIASAEESLDPDFVDEEEAEHAPIPGPLVGADVPVVDRGKPVAAVGAAVSWLAVTLIATFAVWQALPFGAGIDPRGRFNLTAETAIPQFRFGDVTIGSVQGVRSENLWKGPTFVVTAELRNESGRGSTLDGVLRAEVVDAMGTVVASAAMTRLDSADLRQVEPVAYASHVEGQALDLGRRTFGPSERIAVRGFFQQELPDAAGLRFALDPLPPAPPDPEVTPEVPTLDENPMSASPAAG